MWETVEQSYLYNKVKYVDKLLKTISQMNRMNFKELFQMMEVYIKFARTLKLLTVRFITHQLKMNCNKLNYWKNRRKMSFLVLGESDQEVFQYQGPSAMLSPKSNNSEVKRTQ